MSDIYDGPTQPFNADSPQTLYRKICALLYGAFGSGGGSGGSGGAVSVADGADVAEGSTTDAAVAAGAAGTVSSKLRRLTTDIGALNAALATGATRTPTITTTSTGATIGAGKRYIEFIFSSDFAGTIGGQTFSGATDSAWSLPLLNNADTYAALVYTISAGSARLTTLV